jgi:putative glutathione S-transferase
MAATSTEKPEIYAWSKPDVAGGEFHRQVSSFRNFVKVGGKHLPEVGRYHLYVSYACPWAHRTLIVRAFKGLEDVISVSVVDYLMGPNGWHFSTPEETKGCIPDTVNGCKLLRDVYLKADAGYNARFTVPVLWDKKLQTIVSNESSEIIRMMSEFDAFATRNADYDLYPSNLRSEIDEVNQWIYDGINNGVYKSGFAATQEAYERNCTRLFTSLDRVEKLLDGKMWLVGEKFTEADIRLWTTIIRFDPVYYGHFKCNMTSIEHGYPNIWKWARRIYQMDQNIRQTVNMDHIKRHYYMSHLQINPTQVVPLGVGGDLNAPF